MSASHQCEHCGSYGHVEADCLEARKDRRAERLMGCCALVLLAPFAVVGMLLGWAWSAFVAGFRFSKDGWADAVKCFRAKKGPPDAA